MIGDKLIIQPHHSERAAEICDLIENQLTRKYTISVAGESGAGKSELASEIARMMTERNIPSGIIQQDDYFVFPPNTNHKMREVNIYQVGTYEVKLDYLDSNLRSFKRDENPILKPLVMFNEDRITIEELDTTKFDILVVDGTYTSILNYLDLRIFIDRDYKDTLETRKKRARDKFDPFMVNVLEREHQIISKHKKLADFIISTDFQSITT